MRLGVYVLLALVSVMLVGSNWNTREAIKEARGWEAVAKKWEAVNAKNEQNVVRCVESLRSLTDTVNRVTDQR